MIRLLSLTLFLLVCQFAAAAQDKTIVLVRHAERAPDTQMNQGDPELSSEGRERAQRLVKIAKKYKPHEILSTDYKRTKQTAEPIAAYRHKQVQVYDPRKATELIDRIMKSTTEHYLIVGHSNTIPVLANMLAKKEVFAPRLAEEEYGVIWVVRIRKGKLKNVEVLTF